MKNAISTHLRKSPPYAYGIRRVAAAQRQAMEEPEGGVGLEYSVPTLHAFVMLGSKTLFLCHLTMYKWEPHMFQFVVEATLPDAAMERYRKEHQAHPKDTYFLGNSPQDLMTLPEIQSGKRTNFLCDVFRGMPPIYDHWPWEGMTPVIANVRVTVKRIVYFRLFSLNMLPPETLTYIVFGSGDEAHMTNYQTKDPDFDQVVSLEEAPKWVPARELEAGIVIDIPDIPRVPAPPQGSTEPPPTVHCSNPLTESSLVKARYRAAGDSKEIRIGTSYWFCTKIANNIDPCPKSTCHCASLPPSS